MFIPYGSDAPIYHWPFATAGLIVLNMLVFIIQSVVPEPQYPPIQYSPFDNINEIDGLEDVEFDYGDDVENENAEEDESSIDSKNAPSRQGYKLSHGDGLHPVQWITSSIMHADPFHLLGNMIFLWAFGLVIEGRVGPFKLLVLFFGIGIIENMIEQVLFLWSSPGASLGASSVIYGMMMICMLWSPQDNVLSIFIFIFYIFHARVPLAVFALFYFLWDFGTALFSGFEMSTALLHIMGGVVGASIGATALLLQRVDCEDRDLFSLMREAITGNPKPKNFKPKKKSSQEIKEEEAVVDAITERVKVIYRSIDQHLAVKNSQAAIKSHRELKRIAPKNEWRQNSLLKLINLLQSEQRWSELNQFSEHYVKTFVPLREVVRLNLARIHVVQNVAPRKALAILAEIDTLKLDTKQKQLMLQLTRKSKQLIADGVLEVRDDL